MAMSWDSCQPKVIPDSSVVRFSRERGADGRTNDRDANPPEPYKPDELKSDSCLPERGKALVEGTTASKERTGALENGNSAIHDRRSLTGFSGGWPALLSNQRLRPRSQEPGWRLLTPRSTHAARFSKGTGEKKFPAGLSCQRT
jgi:hypothetical protein